MYLFERGCFQACAGDSEDKRDERLEDDLAIGRDISVLPYRKSRRERCIRIKD
jgi:hypothetical protein